MSEADARGFLMYALQFADDELNGAAGPRFPSTVDSASLVIAAIPSSAPQAIRSDIASSLGSRRLAQSGLTEGGARSLVDAALRWYGHEIDSSHAESVTPELMLDVRAQLVTGTYYVAPRGTTPAADPTPADGLILRRLTVGHDNKLIDGGVHNETVTAEVLQTGLTGQGPRQAKVIIYGDDAAPSADTLDYRESGTARNSNLELELFNEIKLSGVISNPNFVVTGAPTNGTAVTAANLLGWTKSNAEGTPTTLWRTSNPWRSLLGGIAHSGNATTARYEQTLVLPAPPDGTQSAYAPIDILTVVYWDGTWEGKVRQYWGSHSQEYAHSLFSGAGFKYLLPSLDSDLYPVNFTTTAPKFAVEVETDSASGELVLIHQDLQRMQQRQGWWYSAWSHTADPAEGTKKTWADACTFEGREQNVLQVLFNQAPWAYLPVSGSNLLAFPARAPEIAVSRNGSNVADGGTVALGTVATGAHLVTLRVQNIGTAALAILPPTDDNDTNATLTDDGFGGETVLVVLPGEFIDLTVEVTDGGAGAFTIDLSFANNTSGDNPFVVTISGTAT